MKLEAFGAGAPVGLSRGSQSLRAFGWAVPVLLASVGLATNVAAQTSTGTAAAPPPTTNKTAPATQSGAAASAPSTAPATAKPAVPAPAATGQSAAPSTAPASASQPAAAPAAAGNAQARSLSDGVQSALVSLEDQRICLAVDERPTNNPDAFNVYATNKCEDDGTQRWFAGGVSDHVYIMSNAGERWCLQIVIDEAAGNGGRGVDVVVYRTCDTDPGQVWKRDSEAMISNTTDDMHGCLSVDYGEAAGVNDEGFNVMLWPDCTGAANQRWIAYQQ